MALTDNIVSYWKFDESSGNASDSVGSLTLTNTSVTYDAGKINNGADCGTGVSSNVGFVGGTPVWNMAGSTAKSIAFWFKPNANATAFARIIDFRRSATSSGEFTMSYYDDSGYKLAGYLNGNTFSYSVTLTVDTWYFIAVTCDASNNVKVYIDASQVTTGTWGTAGSGSNHTQINGANGSMSGGFSGPFSYDEMGLWNRELSSSEITSLRNGGSGLQYPFSTAYSMVYALGTYTYTGFDIAFTKALNMAFALGTYTYTGFDILLSRGRGIIFETGSYIYTGFDIGLTKALTMVFALGSYTYTGFDILFTRAISMIISTGSYIYTGYNIILRKIGWDKASKSNTTSWSNRSKSNTSSWTNQTK